MKVAIILSLFAMTSATLSQATVVSGIENGDGSWSVNGGVFSFSDDFRSFSTISNGEILTVDVQRDILNSSFRAFSGQSADEVFFRSDNIGLLLGGESVEAFISDFSDGINGIPYFLTQFPQNPDTGLIEGFQHGAILGSDNYLVFDSNFDGANDTVVQLDLDALEETAGDSIVNVWHDNRGVSSDIFGLAQSVGGFANLQTIIVPEPSSSLLLAFCGLAFLKIRCR